MPLKQTIVTRVQPDSPGWYWYRGDNSKWVPIEVVLTDDGHQILTALLLIGNRIQVHAVSELSGEWGDEIPLPKRSHSSSVVERAISPKEERATSTRRPAIKAPEQSVIVPEQLAKFLYWISERHSVWLRRHQTSDLKGKKGLALSLSGDGQYLSQSPKPWTQDPILQQYFFCNPFRELDKTTQWFRENVREPLRDDPAVIMATIIFRWFNYIPTGEALRSVNPQKLGGPPTRPIPKGKRPKSLTPNLDSFKPYLGLFTNWSSAAALEILKPMKKVFTGAHVVASGTQLADTGPREGGGSPKVRSICDHIDRMWSKRDELAAMLIPLKGELPRLTTLRESHEYLQSFPAIGDFQAYEIVTDLRHTYVLENAPDVLTWANAGPGAMRGLNRVFGRDIRFQSPAHSWVKEMQCLLAICANCLLPKPGNLPSTYAEWGNPIITQALQALGDMKPLPYSALPKGHPPFELREVEHSLCEFDKYMRMLTPADDGSDSPKNAKRKYQGI